MRTLVLAALTMVTAFGPSAADAQRIAYPGAPYPVPGAYPVQPGGGVPIANRRADPGRPYPGHPSLGHPSLGSASGASRWGGGADGRWYGGTDAPGGWNAYRRPSRGWQLPGYWTSANFFVGDYASYGLSAPPAGYRWHRYYDDAVLLDTRGRVYDSRGGIDWDGGSSYAYAPDATGGQTTSDYGYGYSEDSYAPPQQPRYVEQPRYAPLPHSVQNGAVTTYATGGYAGGYGGGTTVVTIQPTETVTTTTTEYVEETRYVAPRRVYHAPKKHYRVVRRSCGCGCCR